MTLTGDRDGKQPFSDNLCTHLLESLFPHWLFFIFPKWEFLG